MSETSQQWHEQGTYHPKDGDTLTAIEQEGFGIVCAVLDIEGESVYRILRAFNSHAELLEACKAAMLALQSELTVEAAGCCPEIAQCQAAIAKATG